MGTLGVVVRHMDNPPSFWIGRFAVCGYEVVFTGLRLLSEVPDLALQGKVSRALRVLRRKSSEKEQLKQLPSERLAMQGSDHLSMGK